MLTFHDPSRFNRRSFLRVGGVGGLSLAGLPFASRSLAAPSFSTANDKCVVFLFLHGGPSQIETFDPHMEAPAEIRSSNGEVKTSIPGVTFGSAFPRLASLADRMTVVRSFVTGDGNHDIKPVVGRDTFGANLGSVYSHVAGANHPETGMPRNLALFPRAVDPSTMAEQRTFGIFTSHGVLGPATAPFVPGSEGSAQKDMRLALPLDRFGDRRTLLGQLDIAKSALDAEQREGIDGARYKALNLLLGGVADAFDLRREDAKTIARYDTAPLVRPENIDKKWKNFNHYADNAKSIGKLLLLARRLCERGAGFITVTTNFVWDMHADENNAGTSEGMKYMGLPLDYAVSAFLEDLEARGLSEKVLLVVCGEMGRTPKLNKGGGRDHWGNLAPLMLAGGGWKMGQVIGRSSRDGGEPNSNPIRIRHLLGTVMNTLFDVGQLRVVRGLPREIQQMAEYDPIPGL